MEYTRLGSTGLTVSQLCFGTWRFGRQSDGVPEVDREEAYALLNSAWEYGINFFDTANIYGTPHGRAEEFIGEWLTDHDREDVVLASKVYFPFGRDSEPGPNDSGLGRKHIRAQIEGTLERLGTEYLDLYYIHRWDEETPIEETLSTLDQLVQEGTVHYLGASKMAAWQLTKALWKSDVEDYERFTVTQPLFHAGYHDDVKDYLDVCADQNLAVCPYSPLASGFLTGEHGRSGSDNQKQLEGETGGSLPARFDDSNFSERDWHVFEAVETVSAELGATPAQVELRWLIEQPGFTCVPVIGAQTVTQLEENLGAIDISLSDDQFNRIVDARYAEDGQRWGHR